MSPPATWEAFGRELIARRHRKEPTPDTSEFLKTQAPQHRTDARTLSLLKEITTAELRALREALGEATSRHARRVHHQNFPGRLDAANRRCEPLCSRGRISWETCSNDRGARYRYSAVRRI